MNWTANDSPSTAWLTDAIIAAVSAQPGIFFAAIAARIGPDKEQVMRRMCKLTRNKRLFSAGPRCHQAYFLTHQEADEYAARPEFSPEAVHERRKAVQRASAKRKYKPRPKRARAAPKPRKVAAPRPKTEPTLTIKAGPRGPAFQPGALRITDKTRITICPPMPPARLSNTYA